VLFKVTSQKGPNYVQMNIVYDPGGYHARYVHTTRFISPPGPIARLFGDSLGARVRRHRRKLERIVARLNREHAEVDAWAASQKGTK